MAKGGVPQDELDRLLGSNAGPTLSARIKDLTEGGLEEAIRTFDADWHRQNVHDHLLDICASAFGPRSVAFPELGYAFVSCEPLMELGAKSFDLLILKPASNYAIFVECKSALTASAVAVSDIQRSVDAVLQNKTYLEEAIGNHFDVSEYVLCVPAEITVDVAKELARRGLDTTKILLWQVNKFERQLLQLFTLVPGRDKAHQQHADPNLTRLLADGVNVADSEVVARAYPSSHPLRQAIECLGSLVARGPLSEDLRKEFPVDEVMGFFINPANIPHYAIAEVGARLAERFVREGKSMGLLRSSDSDPTKIVLQIEGKSIKTVVANYRRRYRERAAERIARNRAEEAALEEFRRSHPSLFRFGTDSAS